MVVLMPEGLPNKINAAAVPFYIYHCTTKYIVRDGTCYHNEYIVRVIVYFVLTNDAREKRQLQESLTIK